MLLNVVIDNICKRFLSLVFIQVLYTIIIRINGCIMQQNYQEGEKQFSRNFLGLKAF